MREPSIAAGGAASLIAFAAARGANRRELLRRSELSEEELSDPDARIALSRYQQLFRAAKELTNDPALGLHHGEAVDVTEIFLGSVVAAGSGSVPDTFAALNRYARLGSDVPTEGGGDRFELVRDGGALWLVDRRLNPDDFPELTESTFARMVCSTRRGLGPVPIFRSVHFTYAAPTYAAEYERVFQVPVIFSSRRNALSLDESLLHARRASLVSPLVTSVLRDRAEELLSTLDQTVTTRGQVEAVLTKALATGNANVEFVARELAVSRQTLFRRLKAEGLTFANVLEALRRRMATHYLTDQRLSVSQTASLLGYSDPTAFARAFRRWNGVAPGQASR